MKCEGEGGRGRDVRKGGRRGRDKGTGRDPREGAKEKGEDVEGRWVIGTGKEGRS